MKQNAQRKTNIMNAEIETIRIERNEIVTSAKSAAKKAKFKGSIAQQIQKFLGSDALARYQHINHYLASFERGVEEQRELKVETLMNETDEMMKEFGFILEYKSASGSRYYERDGLTVRVADHFVPATAEREYNAENGGKSWSNDENQIIIHHSMEIDQIQKKVKAF